MQWLIDIVAQVIRNTGMCVFRGDPGADDFTLVDFVRDNTWRTLDLSAIVPENVHCVALKVSLKSLAVPLRIQFRRNGQASGFNSLALWTEVSTFLIGGTFPVFCDANRIIEYRAAVGVWQTINVTINGWWY